jgi:tight adherence protein C
MVILALLAVVLLAGAVGLGYLATAESRLRRSGNFEHIEAYGYAERTITDTKDREARKVFDAIAMSIGGAAAKQLRSLNEEELQRELVAAGLFGIGARRFLGYRVLVTLALPVALVWSCAELGASGSLLVLLAVAGVGLGWAGPTFFVHRRARLRLQRIDDSLPELIDLLVVTLEAGVGFTAALRMSADRLEGPLGEEIRLTIQEQALGLSMLDALKNWLKRCDTPSVRSFVRAMVQGERLGVSIGQILRNQAIEMRARRKFALEERAQKTSIKILFPLVFLIFPAMFVVILGPALFEISKELK